MLRQLEITGEANEEQVTLLSEIDPSVDVVIIYKTAQNVHEVEFNVDQFNVNSIEETKPLNSINGVIEFQNYTRIKMMLPLGIFPEFKTELKGTKLEFMDIDKIQGIHEDEHHYSIYNKFHLRFKMYDQKLFASNKFVGMHIPIGTPIASFRLLPHFIESWPVVRDVYVICSSYLYERFPDF